VRIDARAGVVLDSAMLSENMKRYIPLAVWIVVVSTLIFIPLKINSYGFLPGDDAMRHAAKTISGKTWQQILIMRSDFQIDPSPGWQAVLARVHQGFGCDTEQLVIFSVVALMSLVLLCALPWFRRPEAWAGGAFRGGHHHSGLHHADRARPALHFYRRRAHHDFVFMVAPGKR